MNKRLLTEMTDEELMELERLLVRSEAALRQTKPMSEEEAIELCPFTREEFRAGFLTGIRYAEKYHDITDADV